MIACSCKNDQGRRRRSHPYSYTTPTNQPTIKVCMYGVKLTQQKKFINQKRQNFLLLLLPLCAVLLCICIYVYIYLYVYVSVAYCRLCAWMECLNQSKRGFFPFTLWFFPLLFPRPPHFVMHGKPRARQPGIARYAEKKTPKDSPTNQPTRVINGHTKLGESVSFQESRTMRDRIGLVRERNLF